MYDNNSFVIVLLKWGKCTILLGILLTLLLLNTSCPILANSVDPDHLTSEEANWPGSALFVIKYVNFYQKNLDQVIWLAGN